MQVLTSAGFGLCWSHFFEHFSRGKFRGKLRKKISPKNVVEK
jgi:hypothetical protein